MSAFDAFRKFFEDPNNRKEKLMPQTVPTITFDGGDFKPKLLASGLIGFRAPYDIKVEPGKILDVHLNTKCNVFLLFNTGGTAKVVDPGEQVVVRLTAGQEPIFFSEGETFARAMPLLPPTVEIR
jgi:hypothetical protein